MSDLLQLIVSERAQGLEIIPGKSPVVLIRGQEISIDGPVVTSEESRDSLHAIANEQQLRQLDHDGDLRFPFEFGELATFTVKAHLARTRIAQDQISVEFQTVRLAG